MSHITNVQMRMRDLDVTEEALSEIDARLELKRDQKQHKTYYGMRSCDAAIVLNDGDRQGYSVGLVKSGDAYDITYDAFGSGDRMTRVLGVGMAHLGREYSVAAAKRKVREKLAKQGFKVTWREALPSGWTRLRVAARA